MPTVVARAVRSAAGKRGAAVVKAETARAKRSLPSLERGLLRLLAVEGDALRLLVAARRQIAAQVAALTEARAYLAAHRPYPRERRRDVPEVLRAYGRFGQRRRGREGPGEEEEP